MSWLNSILGLLGFILVLPVAAKALNEPQFTLWLFGNSVIAIGILFETSVSVVFTRMLTGYLEQRSLVRGTSGFQAAKTRVMGFLSTALALYLSVSVIGGAIAWLAGRFSIDGLVQIGLDASEASRSLLALGAIAGSSILLAYARSVLIAIQRMRTQRIIMLFSTIGKLLINVSVFASLHRVDLAMAMIALLNVAETILVVGLSWSVQHLALKARPRFIYVDEFFVPFLKTFVIRVGGYLTMYSSAFIIVRYAPQSADSYLLAFRLVQAATSVSLIPVSISMPALTRLRTRIKAGQQPLSGFANTALRLIFFSVTSLLFLLCSLLLFGPWIVDVATSDKTLLGTGALAYLCFIFLLEGHHVAHAMVYETQNRIPYFLVAVGSGIATLALSLLLVPRFGVWGALVSLNLVQMAGNNWVPVWFNLREWGCRWSRYFAAAARQIPRPSPSALLNPDE